MGYIWVKMGVYYGEEWLSSMGFFKNWDMLTSWWVAKRGRGLSKWDE